MLPVIEAERLNVYLASPLTGVEGNGVTYEKTRDRIASVLSESGYFKVYDPAWVTPPDSPHAPVDVFLEDSRRATNADLIVFHVPEPSLGVGIEAMLGACATVPRAIVYPLNTKISRMFIGLFSPAVSKIAYRDESDCVQQLTDSIQTLRRHALESRSRRRDARSRMSAVGIGRLIMQARIRVGMKLRELANKTDILVFWLREIELNPIAAETMTRIQRARIEVALGCALDEQPKQDWQRRSLQNLCEFVQAEGTSTRDEVIIEIWKSYDGAQDSALQTHYRATKSIEEWRREYRRYLKEGEGHDQGSLFG